MEILPRWLSFVRAVVDFLGPTTAFDLLARTQQVQAQGGMIVPETGKPRTSGGIFMVLLKEQVRALTRLA